MCTDYSHNLLPTPHPRENPESAPDEGWKPCFLFIKQVLIALRTLFMMHHSQFCPAAMRVN